jgi:PAS domain S-box-containing protein
LLVLVILASTTLLVARQNDSSGRQQQAVQQSYDRRALLLSVLSLQQDIETGQRGYVLTADPHFLEPYWKAKPRIDSVLSELAGAWDDEPALAPQLHLLRRLSDARIAAADHVVALQRHGDVGGATSYIAAGQGKRIMDAMRATITRMDVTEHAQLDRRVALAREAALSAQRKSASLLVVLILLLAVATRIVARSIAERELAHGQAKDLAARQSAIFAAARDGIIVINASGSIESLNPAAAGMYGYTPDQLVRRDVGLLFEVAPDQGKVETFLKRLTRKKGTEQGRDDEFWGRRADGTTFPVEVSLSLVGLAGGPRFVAIVRDVTERKQIERMKTEFVSTVSHELRTPLTSIAGSLGLLAGGATGDLPGPAARLVTVARDNCQRLIRLINDILDVEKIESGKMRFDIIPVPLADLVEQAVEANGGFARTHDVRLVLVPLDPRAVVMADADALSQVLTNLIANAVKFSPEGKAVRISLTRLDRRYRISVADRGPGIPPEFRPRIFSKFAQADGSNTRRAGGTGLGLAIVREIVTRLGGTVGFEDREGGGTVFHVDLPSAQAVRKPAPVVEEEAGADLPLVLHIDDDPDIVRVTAEAFAGRARMRSVSSLSAARFLLSRERPDAILVDVALSDGSGLDLLAELRQRGDSTPILVFSAQEVERRAARGADAVLVKARATLDDLVAMTLKLADARGKAAA